MLGFHRNGVATVLLLCSAASLAFAGVNQWTSNGPDAGITVDVVYNPSNPSIVYAASWLAVYKSTDGGLNWTTLKEDFGPYTISDLAIDPSNHDRLYVASLGDGIFRSNDAGATFMRVSPIPTDANTDGPNGIAVSQNGLTLYHSTISGRFFRSTDGGQTWSQRTKTNAYIRNVIINPGNSNVVYAAGNKFNKSVDGGDTWTETSPTTFLLTGMTLLPGTPNTIWVSSGGNVYVTSNEGATWTPSLTLPSSLGVGVLAVDPNVPNTLLAAPGFQAGALYQYSGGTWSPRGTPITSGGNPIAIAPGNSSTVLVTNNTGLYRTTNLGSTWTSSHTGMHSTSNRIMTNSGVRTYAGHEWISLAYTVDEGPWQSIPTTTITPQPNPYFDSLAVHPTNPNTLFVGVQQNGVWQSTNGGALWTRNTTIPAMSRTHSIAFDPANANTMYAAVVTSAPGGAGSVVYKSTDGGLNFAPVSVGLTYPFPNKLVVDPQNSMQLYLGGGSQDGARGILRSTDGGVNWTNIFGNVGTMNVVLDPADSKRIYAVTGGLQVSNDSGATWSVISMTPARGNLYLFAIDPTLSSNLYGITAEYVGAIGETFVMRSVDRGQSWERILNKPLQNWSASQLTINPNRPTVLYVSIAERGVQSIEIAPDFGVSILGHSGLKALGTANTFDARIQNAGPYAASDVRLAIAIPTNLQNVTATIDRGSCVVVAGSINCTVPYLRKDELISAHVSYTGVVAGALQVDASVSAHERDMAPSNNTATATATIAELVDLSATASAAPASVTVGDAVTYTVQVTNAGPSASSSTRIVIQLPAGVSITNVTPTTCTSSNLSIDCALGSLNATASSVVTVNATTNTVGTLQATVTATAAPSAVEGNSANNATVASTTVNAKPSSDDGSWSALGLFGLLALLVVRHLPIQKWAPLRWS